MNINDYLLDKNISAYKLAKDADVPYSTVFDMLHFKSDILDCSVRNVIKIAKVLNVKVEELLKEEKRVDFDLFKSHICHNLKRMEDIPFIIDLYKRKQINYYFKKKWYPEALYLLAMVDYLSRINKLPLAEEYNSIRKNSLENTIYPKSILALYSIKNDKKILEKAKRNSIPEFIKYNIVEAEIRNIV